MFDTNESKAKLTAYQRWEMMSFNEDKVIATPSPAAAAPQAPLVSQEEIAKIRENARLDGYANGYQEGFLAGEQEGKNLAYAEANQRTQEQIQALSDLASNFHEQLAHADKLIANDLLDLAGDLARAMFKVHIENQPELILPVINDALQNLPYMQQAAKLFVHPQDAEIVNQHLGAQLEKTGWRVIADAHIERGGCKLETPQNLVDATVPVRWERLLDALRKNS